MHFLLVGAFAGLLGGWTVHCLGVLLFLRSVYRRLRSVGPCFLGQVMN